MRLEELIVMRADGILTVPFHPRLTVIGGLGSSERVELVDTLHRSMIGADTTTELHYLDEFGRSLVVRRSGGRRRVGTAQRGATGQLPLPGPADLPRITHIKATDLGIKLDAAGEILELPSVPTMVERLIGWLGRARNAGGRGQNSLAVLDEPLRGLDAKSTWDVLDAIERLSDMVQVLYLSDDPAVVSWSEQVGRTGRIVLVGVATLVR